jgi:predicted nucleotidyltransferase
MNMQSLPTRYSKDIETITDLLKKEGCKSVFLFGSMVTGKTHPNSDIDIGIKGLPPKKIYQGIFIIR